MKSFSLSFENVPFEILYELEEGEPATFDHPGSPPQAWVSVICIKGSEVNLIDVLSPDVIESIEEELAKEL
jgi:hypothetical protein